MKTSLSWSQWSVIKKQRGNSVAGKQSRPNSGKRSDFFSSGSSRLGQKQRVSAVLLFQFIIHLHTHVPLLITQVHVAMMRSAQGSDVIWLKGI